MSWFRFKQVTLSLIVAVMTLAGGFAQEPDEKAILEELSNRKALDMEAFKKRTERLNTLSGAELDAELKALQKEQAAVMQDWQKIDTLRRTKRPGVPPMEVRSATFALKKWQAEHERDARLQAVQEKEGKAFEKRYKLPLMKLFKEYKEWITTDEYRALEKEKDEINKAFVTQLGDQAEEAEHGNVESEKALATMQRRIGTEFSQISEALEYKTAGSVTALFQQTAPRPQQIRTPPTLYAIRDGSGLLPVAVGEFVKVNVQLGNGLAPYYLGYQSSQGPPGRQKYDGPGRHWFLFSFTTPGQHRIVFHLSDFAARRAEATVDVRVIELKKEPAKADEVKPPPADAKPAAPSPPPPLLTPFAGVYRAHFWASIPGPAESSPHLGYQPPTPVSLTFDTSGNISGRCDYTAPHYLFSPIRRSFWDTYEWKTRFTLQGKVDWQTGKIELKVPDAKIEYWFFKNAPIETRKTEFTAEWSGTFTGRHTFDPFWSSWIPKISTAYDETKGTPNIGAGPGGQRRFVDNGWHGHPYVEKGVQTSNVYIKHKEVENNKGPTSTGPRLITQSEGPHTGHQWYLKLLGPDTTEKELANAELVGTSIWPERKTTVKTGDQVYVTFVGVFGSNYTEIRDLTNIADWQVPPGVQQVRPGVFRAAQAGEYTVRARAKGKDGKWMEGYVTINAI